MIFQVFIRDTKQKIVRVYTSGWKRENDPFLEGLEYNWSEGNYSCDCNRSRAFAHAGKVKKSYLMDETHPDYSDCGHGRFLVKVVAEDKIIFQDKEW